MIPFIGSKTWTFIFQKQSLAFFLLWMDSVAREQNNVDINPDNIISDTRKSLH